jgi:hypothetical protein
MKVKYRITREALKDGAKDSNYECKKKLLAGSKNDKIAFSSHLPVAYHIIKVLDKKKEGSSSNDK